MVQRFVVPFELKSISANNPSTQDAVVDIIAYHDRTKHHPERYANGPGGLDWSNQPESRLRLLVQTEAVKALRQSLRSGVVEINGGGGENVGGDGIPSLQIAGGFHDYGLACDSSQIKTETARLETWRAAECGWGQIAHIEFCTVEAVRE